MKDTMTVGALRAALAAVGDDELVTVYTSDWYYHVAEVEVPNPEDGNVTVVLTLGEEFDTRFDL